MLSATPPRPLCRRSELVHRFKVRLGCDVGEGVGRSQQSVIVVRDDLGVLEIFAKDTEFIKALPVFRAVGVGWFAVNYFSEMTYGGRLAILFAGRKSLTSSDLR